MEGLSSPDLRNITHLFLLFYLKTRLIAYEF